MHRKHGIDRGTEVTEGSAGPGESIPVGSAHSPEKLGIFPWNGTFRCIWIYSVIYLEKLQHTYNTIVVPLIFGIWFGVFPIGTASRPIQLQSATRRPDCGLSE